MTYERRGGPDSTAWCQAQNIYHNRSDRTLDWPDYQPVIAIANSDGSIRIRYRAGYYSQENGWPNGIKGTPPTIPPGKDSFQWTWYSTTAAAGVYCRYVSVTIGGKTYWAEYTASGKRIDCGPADSCSMLPMATPVAQCPAWYATPAPGKAVLSIENRSTEDIDLIDPVTRAVIGKIPRISNGYGYLVLSLAPGHYEYDLSTSKRIVVDLAPGSSIAAVHPTYRSIGPAILETFAATPPAGCAGNVPPPPPPAAQCPEWYQQPPAGKALLVVENYIPGPVTVVDGAGVVPEFTVDANKADAQWRKVLILNPGKYNFNTRENGFIADMVAGQIYTVALTRDTNKKVATIMVPPPGCQ